MKLIRVRDAEKIENWWKTREHFFPYIKAKYFFPSENAMISLLFLRLINTKSGRYFRKWKKQNKCCGLLLLFLKVFIWMPPWYFVASQLPFSCTFHKLNLTTGGNILIEYWFKLMSQEHVLVSLLTQRQLSCSKLIPQENEKWSVFEAAVCIILQTERTPPGGRLLSFKILQKKCFNCNWCRWFWCSRSSSKKIF